MRPLPMAAGGLAGVIAVYSLMPTPHCVIKGREAAQAALASVSEGNVVQVIDSRVGGTWSLASCARSAAKDIVGEQFDVTSRKYGGNQYQVEFYKKQ